MKYDEIKYVLDSGRVFDSCIGFIHPGWNKETIYVEDGREVDEYKVTPEERKEIAEYMISLWNEWSK